MNARGILLIMRGILGSFVAGINISIHSTICNSYSLLPERKDSGSGEEEDSVEAS
jgi:hypothetical protein